MTTTNNLSVLARTANTLTSVGSNGQVLTSNGTAASWQSPAGGTISGQIIAYGSSTAPSGYLACDGSIYSQSSYPTLYATLGTQPSFQSTNIPTASVIPSIANSILFMGSIYSTNNGASFANVGSGGGGQYIWTGTYYVNSGGGLGGIYYRTTPNGAGTNVLTNVNYATVGIVWTGSQAIVTGLAANGAGLVSYSTNGTSWTAGAALSGTTPIPFGIAYGNSTTVIVGSNSSGGAIWTTTGSTNTARTLPSGFGGSGAYIAYVSYVNSLFVAIDTSGGVATSPDGVTWTLKTAKGILPITANSGPFFAAVPYISIYWGNSAISYCNGLYFIGSLYSSDLINWKMIPPANALSALQTGYSSTSGGIQPYPWGASISDGTRVYFGGGYQSVGGCGDSAGEYACVVTPYNYTTGTQFIVPKIVDLQSPNVYYYIKT
jgi:Phage Tail Collar Domain